MSDGARRPRTRWLGGRRRLGPDSPLVGGPMVTEPPMGGPVEARAGAEEAAVAPTFDPRADDYARPEVTPDVVPERANLPDLRALLPATDEERSLDDWGRSESFVSLVEPLLNFYYRYWFRVETEGIENVPSQGGALLVANHSGALPPDGPMVMEAIRNEHPNPRPLYMLGENWFKGFPGVGMLANKLGMVSAHRDNAQRLLHDEGRLAIAFPEGQKGSRKVLWQRYRLRRFGRGGFVRTAIRARVPIVPIAVVGAEEAMPIFAHLRPLQRISGLIYFPLNHAFPQFGLAAGLMYLPAKFKIRFLEPVDMSEYGPEIAEDSGAIQAIAEEIRARIQVQLEEMLRARNSVWFG
ncbi:MAG: acyltransferase family protein [Actinomycetota bacterium]|nr:acyltransferase family protein [Actinomycetota bacterium]